MNSRELVDHFRSGPAELVLDDPLRFRRRTRSISTSLYKPYNLVRRFEMSDAAHTRGWVSQKTNGSSGGHSARRCTG
jgi:hypothetical protein